MAENQKTTDELRVMSFPKLHKYAKSLEKAGYPIDTKSFYIAMDEDDADEDQIMHKYRKAIRKAILAVSGGAPAMTDGGAPAMTDGGAPAMTDGGAPDAPSVVPAEEESVEISQKVKKIPQKTSITKSGKIQVKPISLESLSKNQRKRYKLLDNIPYKTNSREPGSVSINLLAKAYKIKGYTNMNKEAQILAIIQAQDIGIVLDDNSMLKDPRIVAILTKVKSPSEPSAEEQPEETVPEEQPGEQPKETVPEEKECGNYTYAELADKRVKELKKILQEKYGDMDVSGIANSEQGAKLICQAHKKGVCSPRYKCDDGYACDISTKPGICVPLEMKAESSLVYKGRTIVGSKEAIAQLREQLGEKAQVLDKVSDETEDLKEQLLALGVDAKTIMKDTAEKLKEKLEFLKSMFPEKISKKSKRRSMVEVKEDEEKKDQEKKRQSMIEFASLKKFQEEEKRKKREFDEALKRQVLEEQELRSEEEDEEMRELEGKKERDMERKKHQKSKKLGKSNPEEERKRREFDEALKRQVLEEQELRSEEEDEEMRELEGKKERDMERKKRQKSKKLGKSDPEEEIEVEEIEVEEVPADRKKQDTIRREELDTVLREVLDGNKERIEDLSEIQNTVLKCFGLIGG